MIRTKLKHFNKHKQKIRFYCKAVGLKLIYRAEPSDGIYQPSRRRIIIDSDLEETEEVATLLHELGHALDDALSSKKDLCKRDDAYKVIYTSKYSKAQLRRVLKCEVSAWQTGKYIAELLKIPLGTWYTHIQNDAIKGYRGMSNK